MLFVFAIVLLLCLAAMCAAIGFLPVALIGFATWRLGPRFLLGITCLTALAEATWLVAALRNQPSINYVDVSAWLSIAGGGFYAAYLIFSTTRTCACRLVEMEPRVNETLKTRWAEIDVKALGFVSYSDVVTLNEKLPGDSDLASVVAHIRARFAEIAFSCGDGLVLTPAAAHQYIDRVKKRYRNWL